MRRILFFCSVFLICFGISNVVICEFFFYISERAYYEGQKDALTGDSRILQTKNGCWVWSKSPWDNGQEPWFKPSTTKCNEK